MKDSPTILPISHAFENLMRCYESEREHDLFQNGHLVFLSKRKLKTLQVVRRDVAAVDQPEVLTDVDSVSGSSEDEWGGRPTAQTAACGRRGGHIWWFQRSRGGTAVGMMTSDGAAVGSGGPIGGAAMREDDDQRCGPPGRRRGAVTLARRSGG
ncbi:hypothetical protein Syun_026379 [Stephania yunnanensis]|uniref:Uncharacterized protein n=1 Tax=Stephania yunnanensis TaxID=152371 RepID=A0AAP0ETV2_9MAGN